LLTLRTADFLPPGDDTSPRQLPGGDDISSHWRAHRANGCHLVLLGWIERYRPGGGERSIGVCLPAPIEHSGQPKECP
jgi:hypothetical protein